MGSHIQNVKRGEDFGTPLWNGRVWGCMYAGVRDRTKRTERRQNAKPWSEKTMLTF